MLERRRPTWPSGSFSSSRSAGGGISVVGSSTRLASLLVHCLLDFSSRGWSVLGTNERDTLICGRGIVSLLFPLRLSTRVLFVLLSWGGYFLGGEVGDGCEGVDFSDG